tara:strand:- start:2728 stop:4080 length:1353 start_codon:yes stop_codon:yes gene_type:complete
MVACNDILDAASRENVDAIGLSGLITPSLDEMAYVAKEMQRRNMEHPLLIGGATTSRAHTAVKIEPNYTGGPVVHVKDASRAVGVTTTLLSKELRGGFVSSIRDEYATIRERHKQNQSKKDWVGIVDARRNKFTTDWLSYKPPRPLRLGVEVFHDYPLEELVEYIDWTPFFIAWELAGRYPKILDDKIIGRQARELHADALEMLQGIVRDRSLQAHAVIGLYPANSVADDDIELYSSSDRRDELGVVHTLRQQSKKPSNQPNYALADFVAPKALGVSDYLGAFAVNTGFGLDAMVKDFEREHDDYRAIMAKALADRLAEAFAERMHAIIRREYWGYATDELLNCEELIAEKYQGIRPAPGYPACPDHTEKPMLWSLLAVEENIGMHLTENYAMLPTAAVCGWYFSHPGSRYFGVGKINRDQVHDYAKRKGINEREAERWLSPNLGYEPES